MYCSSCGAKNVAESNFCRQCGLKLEKLPAPKISEEAFDRAMPEDEQVSALLELAYRRRKENDIAGAIGLCQEVLIIRPDSTTAHGLLGQLYEQTGDREKAVEQYERVLKLNPGSIADRVKLDDLRDGRKAPAVIRNAMPTGVSVDPNGAAIRGAMIWGVGICVLIILSGAVLAIVFNHPTAVPERDAIADIHASTSKSAGDAAPTGAQGTRALTDAQRTRARATVTSPERAADGASSTGAVFGSGTLFPTYGIPGAPTIQYNAPPIYVYPPGYTPRQPAVPSASIATAGRRPAKTGTPPERASAESDLGGERIHLSVSDGSNGSTESRNVVVTGGNHDDGKGAAQSASKQGPEISGRIVVTPHKGPVDTSSGGVATSDAAAMISVGQDRLNKMDYGGAIIAFRKALAGANDETAYVYEQMARCYEGRKENKNAVTMYEHGRDEFKKLIVAGRQLDRANDGIRICENGIKICTSE